MAECCVFGILTLWNSETINTKMVKCMMIEGRALRRILHPISSHLVFLVLVHFCHLIVLDVK